MLEFDEPIGPYHAFRDGERLLSIIERDIILDTLEACGWSRKDTAQTLGVGIRCILRRLAEYRKQGFSIRGELSTGITVKEVSE